MEEAGIVCLEVKGGEVWHVGAGWCRMRGGKHVHIEPVRQAREAWYALRDYTESDPRWTLERLRWDHVVVCRRAQPTGQGPGTPWGTNSKPQVSVADCPLTAQLVEPARPSS